MLKTGIYSDAVLPKKIYLEIAAQPTSAFDLSCVFRTYMKLIFQDPIASEENNTTDIQFHEGDFVENKDGKIGYISSICHCDECKKRGFFKPTITYLDGTTDYISNYSVKTVTSDYKQIGIQKFSKENELRNRIAALEKENKELKEKVNHLIER